MGRLVTASSTPSTAASPIPAPITAAVFSGPGFIDGDGAAIEFSAIELGDSLVSILVAHLDEPESLGPAGVTVRYDIRRFDFADLSEQVADITLGSLVGQVSNVDSFTHDLS
jgi:hypothetical protein